MKEPYQQLEQELAAWIGTTPDCVVGCASGSAALHLALESLQLPQGSACISPDYSMVATARATVMAGLTPVFVDCRNDLLIDELRSSDCAAYCPEAMTIMAVHVYGRRCNMANIVGNADAFGLSVIEDMAELHGVKPHPSTDAACWSFFRNKVVAGAEGGCVAFRNPEHAVLARQLRCLGFGEAHDYQHVPRGHNYRLSNVHAQLIRESLAVVDANIFLRRQIEAIYEAHCPPAWRMPVRQSVWVYDIKIPGMTAVQQTAIVRRLNEAGVMARFGFKPMSTQAEFKHCRVVGNGNALRLSSEMICLPVQPGITTETAVKRSFELLRCGELSCLL